jgi:Putative Actinobacterial Holin-X, holin superfamily III
VFEGPIASLRHKIDLALKSTVGGIVALVTALVAIGFFCAAAFMWLERKLDPIAAALIIGGFFLLLSLIAVLVVVLVQRKPPPPPPRHKSLWSDPALLATALEVGRTLGPRRVASAVLIGAFLIGMMINRPPRKPEP